MNKTKQQQIDVSTTIRQIEMKMMDTNAFLHSTYEPETYIDKLLNDQCDLALSRGIEHFNVSDFIDILSTIKAKTENQFVTYRKSVDQLQVQCLDEEENHQQTIKVVRHKFNKCIEEFKQIENDVTEISTEVMQAGERLQDLRAEVKRGKQAMEIMELFKKFNTDKQFNPEKYDRPVPKKNFAIIIKKLKTLSKELQNPDTALGKRNIEKFYEYIEKSYLFKFTGFLKEKNIKKMAEIAQFLYYLNGGEMCITEYLENNSFLMDDNDIRGDENRAENDPPVERDKERVENQCFRAFLKKIMDQIQRERRDIEKIFVNKEMVLMKYLEQLFEYRIRGFLQLYLYKGYEEDPNFDWQYLFKYYDSYCYITENFSKNLLALKINGTFLNELIEDMFSEDKEYNYCETEIHYIAGVFKENKEKYNQRKKEIRIDNATKVNSSMLNTFITLDEIKAVINQFYFALKRAQILTIPQNVEYVTTKIMYLGYAWIDDVLVDLSSKMNSLTQKFSGIKESTIQFLTNYFSLIKNIIEVNQYFQQIIETIILPIFKFNFQKFSNYKRKFVKRTTQIEYNISESFKNINDFLVLSMEKMLTYKHEFKCKDENDLTWIMNPFCTPICKNLCSSLTTVVKTIQDNLTGMNKRNFLVYFAHSFHDMYLRVIKKLKITPVSGGLLLMYDVNEIYTTLKNLKFPVSVKPLFDNFNLLFKIFTIPKNNLMLITDALIRDGNFAYVDPNDLLKCRTDFDKNMKVVAY